MLSLCKMYMPLYKVGVHSITVLPKLLAGRAFPLRHPAPHPVIMTLGSNCHFETSQVRNFFNFCEQTRNCRFSDLTINNFNKDLKCFKESFPMQMLQFFLTGA